MDFKNLVLSLLLVAIVASQTCCELNTLKVTGNGDAKLQADLATIQIGATTQAATTSEALNLLNQKINQLITIMQSLGIQKKDYSTSSLSLSQTYDYQNGVSILTGQRANQILSVRVRNVANDVSAIGKLLDAARKVDGVVINGINFDVEDRAVAEKLARKSAFNNAKKKANDYAKLNGLTNIKVVRIQATGISYNYPYYTNADSFIADLKGLIPGRIVSIT